MRYSKDHKAATRQQILIQATQRFLQDGIAATGIAGLMAEAGLTHGGFYAHFASKDDLVAASIASGFQHTRAALARAAAAEEGAGTPGGAPGSASGLEAVIRLYLSPRHRDLPSKGCIAATLSPEIARLPKAARKSFTDEVTTLLQLIADLLPGPAGGKTSSKAPRLDRAIAILTGMMGSLQLSRAVSERGFSDRILELGIATALQLAEPASRTARPTSKRKLPRVSPA
jgi:TetR/AcrR family transcriptional repressor of nem operon